MAAEKRSFILYADLIHTVRKMPKNKAGELFMTILSYVNDENPEVKDLIVDLAFEPIKQQLKRDLKEWEGIKQNRSEAGKVGGAKSAEIRRSKMKQKEAKPTIASKIEANQAVNGTVNVNVTDTVNDTVTEERENSALAKNDLSKSNLFRQPHIPPFDQVHMKFLQSGGTEEMAKSFFAKWDGVGWFNQGSPITNWASYVGGYITKWKENELNINRTSRKSSSKAATTTDLNDYIYGRAEDQRC